VCGIVGYVSHAPSAALLAAVRPALARLANRGPDGSGFLVFSPMEGRAELVDEDGRAVRLPDPPAAAPPTATVVLGHRRLAIIDLTAAAQQPMATPDGRYVLVLNGEIYNYLELRAELESRGHRFRSRSDTEVLLTAFAVWGRDCLPRLVGMFAFAILDTHARRLFLARDPFGMKPLYYTRGEAGLVFASTIAALLPFARHRRVDPQRLYDYLAMGQTDHGAGTLLSAVQSLPAAHYAVIDLDRPEMLEPVRYWRPALDGNLDLSFAEAATRLRDLFVDGIRLHLRSDVRVGTLLSGGIDSSAIVLAMRHVAGSALELHTFSYVGDEGAVSEEPWIDTVAAGANTVSHKLGIGLAEWGDDFQSLAESQDEPFGSIAVYAQRRLYRLASETGTRVILNGQGADELLGGYRGMWSARIASMLKRGQWWSAYRLARQTASHRLSFDPTTRRTMIVGLTLCPPRRWAAAAIRLFGRPQRPWIRGAWCRSHDIELRPPWWAGSTSRQVLRETLWLSVTERTLPALLRYEDRNSMAFSVECRLPFLTTALAEFLLALPESYLIAPDGTSKAIFRAAMRGLVPDAVLDRREKVGFSVPMQSWIPRTPRIPELLDAVSRIPAVDPRGVRALLTDSGNHLANPFRIWQLAALALWAERFDVTFD
jgi:asparagine synthase (glutamine-hydrolysing)